MEIELQFYPNERFAKILEYKIHYPFNSNCDSDEKRDVVPEGEIYLQYYGQNGLLKWNSSSGSTWNPYTGGDKRDFFLHVGRKITFTDLHKIDSTLYPESTETTLDKNPQYRYSDNPTDIYAYNWDYMHGLILPEDDIEKDSSYGRNDLSDPPSGLDGFIPHDFPDFSEKGLHLVEKNVHITSTKFLVSHYQSDDDAKQAFILNYQPFLFCFWDEIFLVTAEFKKVPPFMFCDLITAQKTIFFRMDIWNDAYFGRGNYYQHKGVMNIFIPLVWKDEIANK